MEIRFNQLTKKFEGFTAVNHIDIRIASGAFHFLLGPSGSGKTTTLRLLAGLERVTSGRILFDQEDVTHKPAAERKVGMVFQSYALWPHMTVRENITYPLRIGGLSQAQIDVRAKEVLELMHLSRLADRYPSTLSGGEQQRVALGRGIAIRPRVLLFDEPLSNLDAKLRTEMREALINIHEQLGVTAVYVTHDQKEALAMATHITLMRKGKILQTGPPRELYLNPQTPFTADFLGETNLIQGKLLEVSKGLAAVETPLGVLYAKNIQVKLKEHEEVVVSIRPEAIKIDLGRHALGEHVNIVKTRLIKRFYLGELEQLFLLPAQGKPIRVNLFNVPEYDLALEEEVTCFFKPEKVTVLGRDLEE